MQKPEYECTVLVSQNKYVHSGDMEESRECAEIMNRFHVHTDSASVSPITADTICQPVRIYYPGTKTGGNAEDWTRFGSPIEENQFGNILRWWPVECFNRKSEVVRIVYPAFTLKCAVEYATDDRQKEYFSDIVTPYDLSSVTRKTSYRDDCINKSSTKINAKMPEKEPVKENTMKEESTTETTIETTSTKKPMAKWVKFAIAGAAVAAAAAAVVVVVKKHHDGSVDKADKSSKK